MGDIFYPPSLTIPQKKILLFIGVKEIRNFDIAFWRSLIREVALKFSEHTISVSDMKNHAILNIFEHELWAQNVALVRNNMSFAELGDFAATHELVLGVDGGDINVMRSRTNSITLFTFGNHNVWGPYIMGKSPTTQSLSHDWRSEKTQVTMQRYATKIYKKSFWLPAFQINLSKEIVSDIPISEIVTLMHDIL